MLNVSDMEIGNGKINSNGKKKKHDGFEVLSLVVYGIWNNVLYL